MTRRFNAEGDSLRAAVSAAISQFADVPLEKVEVQLSAPGLDASREERIQVQLQVLEDATEDAEDADDEDADDDEGDEDDEVYQGPTVEELDEEADAAADFLEGLLDVMDLPGDLKIRLFEDYAEVEVVDVGGGALIGRRGSTLEAIQELLRCAMQREFQRRSRVKVDVEGYRMRRLEKYEEKAEEAIDKVLDTGEPERLEPMDVFERKAIHHLVAEVDGVSSHSQGREPGRRIIIEPED